MNLYLALPEGINTNLDTIPLVISVLHTANGGNKVNIFISYHHSSWPLAQQLAGELEEKNHTVHWDFDRLVAGAEFEETIKALIADSDAVVCLLNDSALMSIWCAVELGFADALQKTIIPIRQPDARFDDLRRLPILNSKRLLTWEQGTSITNDVINAVDASTGLLLIRPNCFSKKTMTFRIDLANEGQVDLFDLQVKTVLKTGNAWTSPERDDQLRIEAMHTTVFSFDAEDLDSRLKNPDQWTYDDYLEVLVRFTFQNQSRYFNRFVSWPVMAFNIVDEEE